jgi:hypothetical protein
MLASCGPAPHDAMSPEVTPPDIPQTKVAVHGGGHSGPFAPHVKTRATTHTFFTV